MAAPAPAAPRKRFVASIDQGTTSSRVILFDGSGSVVSMVAKEHRQITPQSAWVEHDALEIWANVEECMAGALEKAKATHLDVAALGITNQVCVCLLRLENTR